MKRLFWENPYLKSIKTKISSIHGKEITMEETIIYSFSGGQESDKADINGIGVVDSKIEINDIVYTLESTPPFGVEDEVTVSIDWDKRYKIMKLHSATHIALAAFNDMAGVHEIIGANVTSEKGRIDFRYPEPINPIILQLQEKVNTIIKEDREIITKYDESSNDPEGRIWIIEGLSKYWKIPCGGTHPKRTSELGNIKLKRENTGKGKERIEITFLLK